MHRLDLTLPDLAANLALDEALLLDAEAGTGGEVLRFWEWPTPAVVLGASGVVADDVAVDVCTAEGVPLARRSSGGGTVLLGRHSLVYSLVLRYDRDPALALIGTSYTWILGKVGRALAPFLGGAPAEAAGSSDLTAAGRKFSGNSQQRKAKHLLHHGTLLLDGYDVASLARYLREPPRQPPYRAGRDHDAFVRTLPATADAVRQRLAAEWGAVAVHEEWPRERVAELVAEKYGQREWTLRR
jgi:lipoate-protein ligase A